jgi:hypothetical protein
MKTLALCLLLSVTAAGFAADTQDLVAAAKASKEKKKKSTTKVITNSDLKKARGNVQTRKSEPAAVEAQKSLVDEYEASYRARNATAAELQKAKGVVAELEHQLAAVEQSYYEENDLDHRDTDIVRQFETVRTKLEAARKNLAALAPAE